MPAQICSACGYEGKGKHIGERSGGAAARVLGMLLMLPIYTLLKVAGNRGGKVCPHCGNPTMVKFYSSAGKLARRRMDIELGILPVKKKPEEEKKLEVFGNERPTVQREKPVDPEQW